MSKPAPVTRYELESALDRKLSVLRQPPRIEWVELGYAWMRFPLCTAKGIAMVSIRVEEGTIDLAAAKELRNYLDIWINACDHASGTV